MSAKELAKGTVYLQAMETGWKPPSHIRAWSAAQCDEVRSAQGLLCRKWWALTHRAS
jgi:ATP-dependent RNA helicase DDX41